MKKTNKKTDNNNDNNKKNHTFFSIAPFKSAVTKCFKRRTNKRRIKKYQRRNSQQLRVKAKEKDERNIISS